MPRIVTGQWLKIVSSGTLMKSLRWQKSGWVCELKSKFREAQGKADVTGQFLRELHLSLTELSKVSSWVAFLEAHICVRHFFPRLWTLINASTGPGLLTPSWSCTRGFNCDLHQGKCGSVVWAEVLPSVPQEIKYKSIEGFHFSSVQGLNELKYKEKRFALMV